MLKIRLRRMGSRHRPFYRVVVSDSHKVPRSNALEEIGYYDPRQRPSVVKIDAERYDHWVGLGAKPSETVGRLIRKARSQAAEAEAEAPTEAAAEAPAAAAADEAAPEVPAEVVAEAAAEASPDAATTEAADS